MELTNIFSLIAGFMYDFLAVLDTKQYSFGGVNSSIADILFGFLVLSIIISVFWKGARG